MKVQRPSREGVEELLCNFPKRATPANNRVKIWSKAKTLDRVIPKYQKVDFMTYVLYKATSPSGRFYVGITNNFKRRMKEHGSSNWPFGHALRKYGKHNFSYEFEVFPTFEEALVREAELITEDVLKSKKCYNACVGGTLSNVLNSCNPMSNPETVANHPNIWSTDNNPDSKARMIASQKRKKVSINGVVYDGVREACRQLGTYRQFMIHRMKSENYPTWYYVE